MMTEKEMTSEVVKQIRKALGLTQSAFWGPVGVTQSVGCRYETDTSIPRSVRILLVIRYSAGLKLDANTREDFEKIVKMAEIQANENVAAKESAAALKVLEMASEHIKNAQASLARV